MFPKCREMFLCVYEKEVNTDKENLEMVVIVNLLGNQVGFILGMK